MPAKSVSVGNAARNGLWSALLAEKGFDGPAEPLAGRQGFYNALGETPESRRCHRRPRRNLGDHGDVLQALSLRLRDPSGARLRAGLAARSSRRPKSTRVVVRGNPLLAHRTDRPDVSTGRESQVSVQHAVAAALVTRRGRARSVHRCLRDRSGRAGAAPQGRGGARSRDCRPLPLPSTSRHRTVRYIACRKPPRAAATPIR